MTVDLIDAIHQDYPNNEIRPFGVSWRSGLAGQAALERPELIEEVLVYGQISRSLFFNERIFALIDTMILNDNQQKQYQAIKTKDTYTVAD